MDQPNLLALSALDAIARHGSVTAAAASLHVTQSAISHRLRALERELGLALSERVGRGLRLTPAALELAAAARQAIEQLSGAIARIAPGPNARALSISCSPSFAIRFLVPRFAAFGAEHPELDLRIAAADVPFDPAHGAETAVVASGATPRAFSEKLIDEVVFPVASPQLLARAAALRTPHDLARHPLLHDEALADDPRRIGWKGWLARAGVANIDLSRGPRFSHAYLALEAALAGDGIALARRSLVADDLVRGRLVAPFRLAAPSGLSYWFVSARDPNEQASAAVARLRTFLKQQLMAAAQSADQVRKKAAPVTRPRAR
ncbi:MAG TPA: LysR substrate-binding domain-containing protein [Polyangiales bacterium]|nr:LysR substrate-binding domain-containing protein [Polyangiales bacterium]